MPRVIISSTRFRNATARPSFSTCIRISRTFLYRSSLLCLRIHSDCATLVLSQISSDRVTCPAMSTTLLSFFGIHLSLVLWVYSECTDRVHTLQLLHLLSQAHFLQPPP